MHWGKALLTWMRLKLSAATVGLRHAHASSSARAHDARPPPDPDTSAHLPGNTRTTPYEPAIWLHARMVALTASVGTVTDIMPSPRPLMMTGAGPYSAAAAMLRVGAYSYAVQYSVKWAITTPATRPTAMTPNRRHASAARKSRCAASAHSPSVRPLASHTPRPTVRSSASSDEWSSRRAPRMSAIPARLATVPKP